VDRNLPTGPMIIIVAFLLVLLSIGFAPGRGLIWALLRRRADRRRFVELHVLRDMYKYAIAHGGARHPEIHPVPESFLVGVRGRAARDGLNTLKRRGWVQQNDDTFSLTLAGSQAAAADVHNQSLWDIYRQYSDALHLPTIPEDRQHDIHDSLSAPAVEQLEQKLKEVTT
jgi:hypothetical protein